MPSDDNLSHTNPGSPTGPRKRPRVGKHTTDATSASCSRCREKKIKCDAAIPVCSACSKSGSTCVIFDSATKTTYTRLEVVSLDQQIHELEEKLTSRGIEVEQTRRNQTDRSNSRESTKTHDRARSSSIQDKRSPGHIPRFIGDESGTGFIQYVLHAIRRGWKNSSFNQQGLEILSGPAVMDHPAHPLPSAQEGADLVTAYLSGFHVRHTLLERREVWKLYESVYQRQLSASQTTIAGTAAEKRNSFQLYLIFALANVDAYRKGLSDKHPFGYFTAGLQNLNGIMSFETIQDIQGFLLIARFGLYYYIGCSVWEICQTCLRICIELGLHKRSRQPCKNLLEEQMRRRVFWECYQLDRFSSVTLGRPFGMEDSDVEIDLPFDAEDEELEQLRHRHPDDIRPISGVSSGNGEVAVFNCCIRLVRITCRIHRALHYKEPLQRDKSTRTDPSHQTSFFEPGDTYQLFRDFYSELIAWRLSCPVFANPQSPAQRQEWFQFLFNREKLTLVQAVIDCVHSRTTFPPRELLNLCHNTAAAVIDGYDNLRRLGQVTYSWSYLQLMLSCGLSVIFCVFVKLDQKKLEELHRQRSWLSHRWTDLEPEMFTDFSLEESSKAIDICAEVHSWMGEQAKEMTRYSRFFNMMRARIQERIKQADGVPVTTSPPDQSQLAAPHISHQIYNSHSMTGIPVDSSVTSTIEQEGGTYHHALSTDYAGQQNGTLYPGFEDGLQNNWPSTESINTFEPLVRQLFGNEQPFSVEEMELFNATQGFSPWEFSQEPLLAEFTSGLEGYM